MPQPIKGRKRNQRARVRFYIIPNADQVSQTVCQTFLLVGLLPRRVYSWLGRDYKEWSKTDSNPWPLYSQMENECSKILFRWCPPDSTTSITYIRQDGAPTRFHNRLFPGQEN